MAGTPCQRRRGHHQYPTKPVWIEVLEAVLLLGIAGAAIVLVTTWLMLASLQA